ncbi:MULTISPECIES: WD40 repeat domain-containing protein [unclassified Anabaena]|uniref:WD40 repeat domain-containing protein n=1 Tax=unclassified Anabaena TaxID=2619674 RepID=UPI0039C6F090
MTPLLLGQLVYTSFAGVGFTTLVSTEVPAEVQQAFIQEVVYQYWDSYNPPSAGYQAAYLYQVTPEQCLFGWLYNDGLDDFGRSDVPYFVCYYLAGKLQPIQLENIFICLRTGPATLIDRQNVPDTLENVVAPDLWNYHSARAGVEIPRDKIDQSQMALQEGELLNLFAFTVDGKIPSISISHRDSLAVATPLYAHDTIIPQEIPIVIRSAEDYRQILLGKAQSQYKAKKLLPHSEQLTLILGIIVSMTALLALVPGSYYASSYFLKVTPFEASVPQTPDFTPSPNPVPSPQNLALTQTLAGHGDSVWSVALTANGQTLVSASADKTIKVWNVNPGKIISTLEGHTDTVREIAISSDGQTLVSGSGDKTIKVWNLQTFEIIRTITPNGGPVWSVAISSDGQTLVSGTEDGNIQIWNFHTGQLLRTIQGHESRVFSVAISPDGETLATGGLDKTIKIWDMYTGELRQAIAQHNDAVRYVAFSRDGETLASASWDQSIKIWDLQTGKLLHTLLGHTSRVVTLSMGLDGQTLLSGSIDNMVKMWDMQTGNVLQTLSGHSDWVLALATNPTQKILVSSSKDKTIRIWQPQIKN